MKTIYIIRAVNEITNNIQFFNTIKEAEEFFDYLIETNDYEFIVMIKSKNLTDALLLKAIYTDREYNLLYEKWLKHTEYEVLKKWHKTSKRWYLKESVTIRAFKKLGFDYTENDLAIIYDKYDLEIAFIKEDKIYFIYPENADVVITPEIHKAINKQLEELGWL